MAGVSGLDGATAGRYLTTPVWLALVAALIGAGPMIPFISRWRVSLDVAAASILMMFSATGVFVWMGGALILQFLGFQRHPGGGQGRSSHGAKNGLQSGDR
jgi:hypothetical protein